MSHGTISQGPGLKVGSISHESGNLSGGFSYSRRNNIVSAYADRTASSLNPIDLSDLHPSIDSHKTSKSGWQESEFKKMPLPKFSGDPCDWPEFRAIWLRYITHARQIGVDQVQLVYQLKQCLGSEARERVSAIYATQARSLEHMFEALESVYSDIGSSVQFSLSQLSNLDYVQEGDFKGLVRLINSVERCYSQLAEVGQVSAVNLTHVDNITDRLPFSITTIWMNLYQSMEVMDKIHPFSKFMLFLSSQRDISQRYANRQALKDKPPDPPNFSPHKKPDKGGNDKSKRNAKCFQTDAGAKKMICAIHENAKHDAAVCKSFTDKTVRERYDALKSKRLCFRCFGSHIIRDCPSKETCGLCGSKNHNDLLCERSRVKANHVETTPGVVTGDAVNYSAASNLASVSHHAGVAKSSHVIFAVRNAKVKGVSNKASLFFDSGSNSSFITRKAAKRLKSRLVGPVSLELTTMGGGEKEVETEVFEIELVTSDFSVVVIQAYCMDFITGPVSSLDNGVLGRLFPEFEVAVLQRISQEVDILIGMDLEGLHPVHVLAEAGPNLRVRSTPFGPVLMGSHSESLVLDSPAVTDCGRSLVGSHAIVKERSATVVCNLSRVAAAPINTFIGGEELGTAVYPKFGSCKCSKCPIPGHSFSFLEEQELRMIRSNLKYDSEGKRWITKYPWIVDPNTLPNNFSVALATLKHTEKILTRDDTYDDQIKDMVNRGVAKVLSNDELQDWNGPVFYLSHLAVLNPKSLSTPVRIVFNSSQMYQGFSLNGSLAKGPDSYLNSLLGVLLRWRENCVALTADIRKMYNSIYIEEVEQHCHRFLWRSIDSSRPPDVYTILRVNMGDKPAGAISTEAVYLTAEMFQERFPKVATLLKSSTYVDDIVDSVSDMDSAVSLSIDTVKVLGEAGFRVKHWLFSGENGVRINPEESPAVNDETLSTKVLGVSWLPCEDVVTFTPSLNFSPKRKGVYTGQDLVESDLLQGISNILTRRMVLEQTMKVYDPFGLISPFTLIAKILLRRTWSLSLGWDDAMPSDLHVEWVEFFRQMFLFSQLRFDRSIMPKDKVGQPILVILSDGSDLAYGCAAYIRWALSDGTFWCRLVMSKCRIAPMRKISTPQMELNGAVLNKRIRKVLENELRLSFEKIYQLVNSETVLHMINKLSTCFKIYEGVRISEIKNATDGNVTEWSWVPGTFNVSDWVTRGKPPIEIGRDSQWWLGPSFLYQSESEWPVRGFKPSDSILPGEKQIKKSSVHTALIAESQKSIPYDLVAFSSARSLLRRLARLMNVKDMRSLRGCRSEYISAESIQSALEFIVRIIQKTMESELKKVKGKYHQLAPVLDHRSIWVVGSRFARYNPISSPLSEESQILLPSDHRLSLLLMVDAHEDSMHRGRDSTLARFRHRFWITQGSSLAKRVVNGCYECRRKSPVMLSQQMGLLPIERLTPAPPFTSVMLDLFGPYSIRGEVQKRVTGKGYGIIITDMFSRAVHIEGVFAYDTQSFLNALARFASIRGWPEVIYSDCGTQIVAASNALRTIWKGMDQTEIVKGTVTQGAKWIFGPPDSPWQQGLVESLVKSAKRAIHYAVGDKRLSASEFLTVCTCAANIMNERPLGILPGSDSRVNLFTPNSLLIGRAIASQPGGLKEVVKPSDRLAIIDSTLEDFWKLWVELYAPTLVAQSKWTRAAKRELQVGDIVTVADSNAVRGRYYIARVTELFPGLDGRVRKVALEYRNCAVGATEYKVSKPVKIIRAVQRLALLVPVDGEGYPMYEA